MIAKLIRFCLESKLIVLLTTALLISWGILVAPFDWKMGDLMGEYVENLRAQIGKNKILCALSGGVDSTVAAILLHKAIGKNLYCFFVDNGFLRKNEFEEVLLSYKGMGLNIEGVDARQRFWDGLAGVTDPEAKRKVIGKLFIELFEEESEAHPDFQWLGQGTIYPDVIESAASKTGKAHVIKSHHNVGGLPEKMNLKVVEPLNTLFKDEVRRVGHTLEIPGNILNRHPFPGPGLGIRIIGDVTAEKVRILQDVDHIFINGLKGLNLLPLILNHQQGAESGIIEKF